MGVDLMGTLAKFARALPKLVHLCIWSCVAVPPGPMTMPDRGIVLERNDEGNFTGWRHGEAGEIRWEGSRAWFDDYFDARDPKKSC